MRFKMRPEALFGFTTYTIRCDSMIVDLNKMELRLKQGDVEVAALPFPSNMEKTDSLTISDISIDVPFKVGT